MPLASGRGAKRRLLMKVKDIPGDAMFISDSQDVSPILADFGIVDDDIGGVFITKDGKVYGISGSVAYLEYHVFYIGQDANYASDEQLENRI